MTPIEFPEVRLVLKSGNFGKQDFFIKAIKTIDVHETKRKEAQ